MPRNRFAQPTTVRLPFADDSDDWIEAKTELTYGETLDLSVAAAPRDDEGNLGWFARYQPARAALWLVDWSFCGADGAAVELAADLPAREEQIRSLDQATGREVQRLLDEHEDAVRASGLGKAATEAGMATPEVQEVLTVVPPPPKASSPRSTAA